MKKVEAIIRVEKVDEIVDKLSEIGHSGITKTNVDGHGKQKGILEQFRGKEYRLMFIPKVKIEMVVKDKDVEDVIRVIRIAAVYAFAIAGTLIVLLVTKLFVKLRVEPQEEIYGLDLVMHGERLDG